MAFRAFRQRALRTIASGNPTEPLGFVCHTSLRVDLKLMKLGDAAHDLGGVEKGTGGTDRGFEVFSEPSVSVDPVEEPFNDS